MGIFYRGKEMTDAREVEWRELVKELENANNENEFNRLRIRIIKFINEKVLGVKKRRTNHEVS